MEEKPFLGRLAAFVYTITTEGVHHCCSCSAPASKCHIYCIMKSFTYRIQFWHATFPIGQLKLPRENLSLSPSLLSFSHVCPIHLCKEIVQEVPKVKDSLYFSRFFFIFSFFNLICHVDRRSDCNSAQESVSQPGNHWLWSGSNTEEALADTQCEFSCMLQSVNLWCTLLCSHNLSNSNHCTMSRS